MIKVFEVRTVERVWRTYLVQMETTDTNTVSGKSTWSNEDLKIAAENFVRDGSVHKFTEGDAEIEEILSVTES